MKMPIEQAVNGAIGYLSSESTKISDPMKRFLLLFSLGAMKANPASAIAKYKPMLEAAGAIDCDGLVDTDAINVGLSNAFQQVPIFTAFGFDFSSADVEPLIKHLHQGY